MRRQRALGRGRQLRELPRRCVRGGGRCPPAAAQRRWPLLQLPMLQQQLLQLQLADHGQLLLPQALQLLRTPRGTGRCPPARLRLCSRWCTGNVRSVWPRSLYTRHGQLRRNLVHREMRLLHRL